MNTEYNAQCLVREAIATLQANPLLRTEAMVKVSRAATMSALRGRDLADFADALSDLDQDVEDILRDHTFDYEGWDEDVVLKKRGDY